MAFVGRYSVRILIQGRKKRADHLSAPLKTGEGPIIGGLREIVQDFSG